MKKRTTAKQQTRRIRATLALDVDLRLGHDEPLKVELATADGKSAPRFAIQAYTGKPIRQWWSEDPVVVNLAGMSTPKKPSRLVILRDHDPSRPIGHGLEIQKTDRDLTVAGAASIPGADTDEFIQGS